MLLSVITPTNNPQFLAEAHRSLQAQRGVAFEWLIAPNGAAIGELPKTVTEDPRVRVVPYTANAAEDELPRVGALKRHCCDHAKGHAFVELDHDDMLMPGTLAKLAAKLDAGAGFVYSDTAVFEERNGRPVPIRYGADWGWETYPLKLYGHQLLASRAFDVDARSLCEIYYAPDHVRCWSREAYKAAGGHDGTLSVGDDHDLLIRTYLSRVPFAHTAHCGYLYRNHPGNTVKERNAAIQQQQSANRDKYIYELVDEWIRRTQHLFFDAVQHRERITFTPEGISIDAENNSVGCFRAWDFMQRIPQNQVARSLNEIYRVLVPGGWLLIAAPSTECAEAFSPIAKSFWNKKSFGYLAEAALAELWEGYTARFQLVRCFDAFPTDEHRQTQAKYVYADLCALKGQRQPGMVRI